MPKSNSRRIRITHIHPEDARHVDSNVWVGQTGSFEPVSPHHYKGYYTGRFYPDSRLQGQPHLYFLAIRYKRI